MVGVDTVEEEDVDRIRPQGAAALGDGSVRVVDPRSPSVVAVLLHLGAGKESGAGLPAATGVAFSPSANELVRLRLLFRPNILD